MDTSTSPWFFFFIASLAVWRVTHLFNAEDGPFDILVRLRTSLGDRLLGKLTDCFYCLSVWIAAPFAVLLSQNVTDWLLMWLALSGSAIFLERIHAALDALTGDHNPHPYYAEDPQPPETASNKGENHGMLRK